MNRRVPTIGEGQVFPNLIAQRLVYVASNHRFLWECKCVCGTIILVRENYLISKKIVSCGCVTKKRFAISRRKAPGHHGLVLLYNQYRHSAFEKGLEFVLNLENFKKITSESCRYCGVKPSQKRRSNNRYMSEDGKTRSEYIFSGIDRSNNEVGYVLENCVPCCWTCNFAKNTRSSSEFITWARAIADLHPRESPC